MSPRLNIVLVSSEAAPFSKTGGLGDVSPALARALDELGHHVTLIVPHYPQIYAARKIPPLHRFGLTFDVEVGPYTHNVEVLWSKLPRSNVTVLHIDRPQLFDRPGLYTQDNGDYADNSERFILFSRATMQTAERLLLRPDIIHANDWQTGLVPALLGIEYRSKPAFMQTASVFTIHNLLFQGRFRAYDMNLTGLDWRYFNWTEMEAYNDLNLLKTGIVFAEKITTVSPNYAREIQTPDYGNGLDPVLASRSDDLVGILNGIDENEWNPVSDDHLPQTYDVESATEGKAACKRAVQIEMGLPTRDDVPLLTMVSRMTGQKGIDLILDGIDEILALDVQLAFLGTGEHHYEKKLQTLSEKHPDQIAVYVGFSEPLAHRLEAAADLYLMPSAFEPCGLNQLYSMRYGTVPIVRAVGGLADSVVPLNAKTGHDKTATGFSFTGFTTANLLRAIRQGVAAFRDRPVWRQLVRTGMETDFSWRRSASEYTEVYRDALAAIER